MMPPPVLKYRTVVPSAIETRNATPKVGFPSGVVTGEDVKLDTDDAILRDSRPITYPL